MFQKLDKTGKLKYYKYFLNAFYNTKNSLNISKVLPKYQRINFNTIHVIVNPAQEKKVDRNDKQDKRDVRDAALMANSGDYTYGITNMRR